MDYVVLLLLGLACLVIGAGAMFLLLRTFGRKAEVRTLTHSITERIRSVGKLTGLEVMSKEIVTQTKGLNWLPPLLLSQARLAMIFHFEKQYYINLARLEANAVQRSSGDRFVITLPPIEGHLNLLEVIPYDIQSGKLLGLLDVFKMDAEAQKEMMQKAQVEASRLYEENAARYEGEARRAIARQVHGLLELFDVAVEVRFTDDSEIDDGAHQLSSGSGSDSMNNNNNDVTVESSAGTKTNGSGGGIFAKFRRPKAGAVATARSS